MARKYPLFKAAINVDDALVTLKAALTSGYLNEGEFVSSLEKKLSQKLAAENLTLVNSCTSALTLALSSVGAEADRDVITTPMTCVATNTPIVNLGANVFWADCDPQTGMVTAETCQDAWSSCYDYQPVAIIAVAWAGTPPPLREIREFCTKKGVSFIIDAAHAFGATYEGKPIHEWADYTCYSFQAIKHFTTGDGGAIVCRSRAAHGAIRKLKWFGLDRDKAKDEQGNWRGQQWDADIDRAGFKFNMNNVAAAIGLANLQDLDRVLATHKTNAAAYDRAFTQRGDVINHAARPVGGSSAHWVYTALVDKEANRDKLLALLNAEGIEAGLVHVPNDTYSAFQNSKRDLPGVREFSSRQLSLPCGHWLSDSDIAHIASRVIAHLDSGECR